LRFYFTFAAAVLLLVASGLVSEASASPADYLFGEPDGIGGESFTSSFSASLLAEEKH
jgi:hypothetical protein